MRSMKTGSILIRFACAAMLLFALSFALNAVASSEGVHGGGGDMCEDRVQQIRNDLKSWIYKGGAQGLSLPQGVSADHYADLMLDQIKAARVKCVGVGDKGYPVKIRSTPKVCKFLIDQTGSQITCDYVKFLATSESDQYVLIHHEYAGLAGIEMPNQDDSRYEISNQISGYLEEQVVKKLAVKLVSSELHVGSRVVIEDDHLNALSTEIIRIISEKSTYYQVWRCRNFDQYCDEQTIERSSIKGSEVSSLNGVKKGQKAVCKNPYGPVDSVFEGRVAHIYSNGFVEIDISTNTETSDMVISEPLVDPILYWSSIPGFREVPRFGYNCHYK